MVFLEFFWSKFMVFSKGRNGLFIFFGLRGIRDFDLCDRSLW